MPVNRSWFQILVTGALLYLGATQALRTTGNPNFVPTVIMVGAFVVPAAFVAYFYGHERVLDRAKHMEAPIVPVLVCFLVGGVISTVSAGFLEFQTLRRLFLPGLFGVALIEESVKMIFPLGLYLAGRYRSAADGLLFGVASGMGFAALETMGYGLVALINSRGNVGVLEQVLLVRGLLSPVGHAAWTGLVCASLWRGRQTGRKFNAGTLGTLALAVALHGFWNLSSTFDQAAFAYGGYVLIGLISLVLLVRQWRQAG